MVQIFQSLFSPHRKPAKDPDSFDDSEVLKMLKNSSISKDSGLATTPANPPDDFDGMFHNMQSFYNIIQCGVFEGREASTCTGGGLYRAEATCMRSSGPLIRHTL